jgi:hypothetical protein
VPVVVAVTDVDVVIDVDVVVVTVVLVPSGVVTFKDTVGGSAPLPLLSSPSSPLPSTVSLIVTSTVTAAVVERALAELCAWATGANAIESDRASASVSNTRSLLFCPCIAYGLCSNSSETGEMMKKEGGEGGEGTMEGKRKGKGKGAVFR